MGMSETISFQAGAIYALNKIQEILTGGAELRDIEAGINRMLERIFNEFDKLF